MSAKVNTPVRKTSSDSRSTSNLDRRDLLLGAAAGAGALAMSGLGGQTLNAMENNKDKLSGYIDAHSHIWTRDVKNFPLASGQTVDDLAPPSFTAEELLKLARPLGVARVVLIQHHTYHSWDNSYLIDAARRYPGVFVVTGMVDDTQPHPDLKMRKLHKQNVTAFRITSMIRGKDKWLEGPGMDAMWKEAAKSGQVLSCLINEEDMPAVDQMCKNHPDTPVVIDHFARIGVDGKIRESDLKQLCGLAKHKNANLKISAYYALGKKKPPYLDLVPMIRRVLDAYGPERTMWASDSPYQVVGGHSYKASLELIEKRIDFLSDGDRKQLLGKTAERLYFA